MNKQYIDDLTSSNKKIIVMTETNNIICSLLESYNDYIKVRAIQISNVITDELTDFDTAIIPLSKIIAVCTFNLKDEPNEN